MDSVLRSASEVWGEYRRFDDDSAARDRPSEGTPAPTVQDDPIREQIITALRGIQDPELPVNIYDLGLIYRLDITPEADVAIEMTLTAPTCPVAGIMPTMVKNAVIDVEGVGIVAVELVWDPPWTPELMSETARLECNML